MVIVNLETITKYNQQNNIMIVDNKQKQNILFIGSCRIHAFLNYFLNDDFFGNNYNYLCVLVYIDNMTELSKTCIHNDQIKNLINNTTILVSEYLKNYKYFNSSIENEYNIFQLNSKFQHTIFLPNYCDPKIYVKDIIYHGDDKIKNDFKKYLNNEISFDDFVLNMKTISESEINRYCEVISKSFIPEFEIFIRENVYNKRISNTIHHPTNILSIEMYRLIMLKIFNRNVPENVIILNNQYEFLNSEGYKTKLTYYDKIGLNINIDEAIYNKEQSDKYLLSTELFYKE